MSDARICMDCGRIRGLDQDGPCPIPSCLGVSWTLLSSWLADATLDAGTYFMLRRAYPESDYGVPVAEAINRRARAEARLAAHVSRFNGNGAV